MKRFTVLSLLFLVASPVSADTNTPDITLLDLWIQHRAWIIVLSILLSLLTAALVRVGWQRWQLRLAEQRNNFV